MWNLVARTTSSRRPPVAGRRLADDLLRFARGVDVGGVDVLASPGGVVSAGMVGSQAALYPQIGRCKPEDEQTPEETAGRLGRFFGRRGLGVFRGRRPAREQLQVIVGRRAWFGDEGDERQAGVGNELHHLEVKGEIAHGREASGVLAALMRVSTGPKTPCR
jgi:hypothetical protein